MFPGSSNITEISDNIINDWHANENRIFSFDDAAAMLSRNTNKNDIYHHVELLSLINTCLWHEEDKARDTAASDSDIANVKRKIDMLNAMRVNKAEEIDDILLKDAATASNAPLNSEALGSIIDRLTILALKKYHMEFEANRKDASEKIKIDCSRKLNIINTQIKDLSSAYDFLIEEIKTGKRRYTAYRQFKMYNDPELNPVLYNKKS